MQTFLSIEPALSALHGHWSVCMGAFWECVGIIFGGLVIWAGFIFAHFVLRKSSPRGGRRR